MGCGYSTTKEGEQPVRATFSRNIDNARSERKLQKINGRLQPELDGKMLENVTPIEDEPLSKVNEDRINELLRNHFFFYGLSPSERSEIVKKIVTCRTEAGSYVFKQGDLASAFFIIAEGRVQVEISGSKKKILQKGDYFGELALIYMAPRSASIKALTSCQFWCITRAHFRQTVEDYVKKNYALAKEYLDKFQLFSSLTEKQRDTISYNMLSLKYENEEVIFKLNDDANSFFIVTKGKVEINIPGKDKLTLQVGESFGEQSFQEGQVRGGTAIARGQTVCLSIGRDFIKTILGDRINNISNYNVTKWALKRSQILSKLSSVQIQRLLEAAEFKSFEDGEKVYKKGEPPRYLVIPIEGGVEDRPQGQIVCEQFLNYTQGQNIDRNYTKKGKGIAAVLTFQSITRFTNKKTSELVKHVADPYEKEMEEGTRASKDYSHIQLDSLVFLKKLGEGQFGRVYLVRESKGSNNIYALKCIKKQQVVDSKMEKIILEEKRILERINFPLTVGFVRSFKDSHFIYLLMEYIKGSELFDVIREIGILSKQVGRFYLGCLLLSLEYLHLKNIIYRDLKPENVMVDGDGYLKLIDMGTAKQLTQEKGFRTFTIIGTPHYMAPEVMQGKGYSLPVDLWSLGVLLFEFLCGALPFGQELQDPYQVHSCIVKSEPKYPSYFTDDRAKKLIQQLLSKTPEGRAPKGFPALKANSYFDGLVWEDIYSRKMTSPYIPKRSRVAEKPLQDAGLLLSVMQQEKAKILPGKSSPLANWDQQF